MRNLVRFLIPFLIMFILIRFFSYTFVLIFRYWFISLPIILVIYFHFRRRIRRRQEFTNLDPDKEIKIYPESTVEDDE